MKNVEPFVKQIEENIFYIRPFSAFKAANISGELVSLLSPILVSVLPALTGGGDGDSDNAETSIFDMDISKAMPSIMKACSSLDGDKLEDLMKSLICKHRNISYENESDGKVIWLEADEADSLFAGRIEDMFVLAFEVIKLNFKGFFKNLGNLSGNPGELLRKMANSTDSDTSTKADSTI